MTPLFILTPRVPAPAQIKSIPVIKVTDKYLGELTTRSYRDKSQSSLITTELRNRFNKILGFETFKYTSGDGRASGALIYVKEEYRKKSFHLGEILRLSTITAMIENKIKEFEIFSKDTAIYFHSKYGFEPAVLEEEEQNTALISMIKHCTKGYEDIKAEAEHLLSSGSDFNKTNSLLKKYIARVLETKNEYKSHQFTHGMRMILTDKCINDKKDFFNGLFEKHGIDYKI